MAEVHKQRPVFFNVLALPMPVTALVSFAHRVSGILLALLIALAAYLLQRSLEDAEGYAQVVSLAQTRAGRLSALIASWALAHHALAGVRHLLFDIGIGTGLPAARASAKLVFAAELVVVALVAALMS